MKKRQSNSGDSFDLFLDTVCNAFGGIVFIAILVAILVQTRSVTESLREQLPYDVTSLLSDEEMVVELDRLKSKRSRLQELLASLKTSPKPVAPDTEEQPSAESTVLDQIDDLEPKLESSLSSLQKYTAANKQLEDAIDKLEAIRRAMESAAAEEIEQEEEQQNDLITFQVPRAKTTSKETYSVLLKGGLIYVAGYASGLNKNIFTGSDVSVRKSQDGDIFWARPAPNAVGKPFNSSTIQSMLTRLEVRDEFLTMIVWDDSYGTFQELKNFILERGLGYRTWIVPPGASEMQLGFTSERATIQ